VSGRTRTRQTSADLAVRQAVRRAVHQGPLCLGRPLETVHPAETLEPHNY
jgi:hypothetical protein